MTLSEILYNFFWVSIYVLLFGLIVAAFFWGIGYWIREKKEKEIEYKLTFLQVKLPKENEIEIKAAEHMFSNLFGFKKPFWQKLFTGQYRISFEIVSKPTGISFYVVVPDEISGLVEKQINGAYPSAEIDIINPHEVWDRGDVTLVEEIKLKGPSFYPIKVYEDQKNDTLSSITSAMSKLNEDEVIAVQYVIQPANEAWHMAGRHFISNIKRKSSNPEKNYNIDTSFLEGIEKKIGSVGFYTKIRIVSIAKDKTASRAHVQNMLSAFEQFTDANYNRFVARSRFLTSRKRIIDDFIYRRIRVKDFYIPILGIPIYSNTPVLNIVEMATVFHFPNKNVETPNIVWMGARKSETPVNLPESGLFLGRSTFRGVEQKVYLKEDDRKRHLYIMGQTGTGKSELMTFLALQDIKNGEGVAVIDPHGSDIDNILEKIPPERIEDVILFDVSDTERPMGLNILEAKSEEEKHLAINAFIALLYKLYDPNKQGIMGPQLERAIRNVMLTAMTDPESTMVDVLRLLIDSSYSKKFIDKLQDPLVKRYWTDEVAKTTDFHKSEKMGYFVSKFDRFVTEKIMRNIVGQPKSAFDLHEVMAQKKILLVDLAKGKIGEENSNFLGLMLVPRILAAAFARHKYLGKEDFPNFYLYVDEFQNFATPDFATILSEARKYKLSLTVAHQFVAQLDEKIKDAIFGNVGSKIIFRVGAEDAEYLEPYFTPRFTKEDLVKLPVGSCYVQLLVDGQPTPPFSMAVKMDDLKAVPKDPSVAQKIREMSSLKHGTPIKEVEEYINLRSGFNEPQVPPMLYNKLNV